VNIKPAKEGFYGKNQEWTEKTQKSDPTPTEAQEKA
jgi:hypothetical protein